MRGGVLYHPGGVPASLVPGRSRRASDAPGRAPGRDLLGAGFRNPRRGGDQRGVHYHARGRVAFLPRSTG